MEYPSKADEGYFISRTSEALYEGTKIRDKDKAEVRNRSERRF